MSHSRVIYEFLECSTCTNIPSGIVQLTGTINHSWLTNQSTYNIVYFPTQICFPIGGDHVACPWENNMNFRLARDQVMLLSQLA